MRVSMCRMGIIDSMVQRMGSFTSRPLIAQSSSSLDDVVDPPEGVSHEEFLQWVRSPLAKLPSLLPRDYRPARPSHMPTKPSGVTFRLLQWNILAQALGCHADNFVKCPPEALQWGTRRYRILEEILSHQPDIICLQEVDHYGLLKRVLGARGYEGFFMAKPDSPCIYLPENSGPDGCALFFRTARFQLVEWRTRVLEVWRVQSNQVALLVTLREKRSGCEFVVLTTHLKARTGALLASLRNEQGKDLLNFLEQHRNNRPAVVCGDMNAVPEEPVYATLTQSTPSLASAYAAVNEGKEPPYSTWKIRGDGETKRNLDYVLYTDEGDCALQILGSLDHPREEDLGPGRAPSLSCPSDHFSLVCDFALPVSAPNDTDDHTDEQTDNHTDSHTDSNTKEHTDNHTSSYQQHRGR